MRHLLDRDTLLKMYEGFSISSGDAVWVHHPITEDVITVNVVRSTKDKVLVTVQPGSPYAGQPDWWVKKTAIIGINERAINEDRFQAEIPFGKKSKVGVIAGKPEHIQLLDAFTEFAKKTKFTGKFVSIGKFDDYMTDELAERVLNKELTGPHGVHDMSMFYFEFFSMHPLEDYPSYYDSEWFTYNDAEMTSDYLQNMDVTTDFTDIFTEEGLAEFKQYSCSVYAKEHINDHGLIDALEDADTDGLRIYRAITIQNTGAEIYDEIVNGYTGAGYYWSFSEKGAEAHNGGSGTQYTLHGRVRLQDINWDETYLKNLYMLSDEREIEVKADGIIKLEKIFNEDIKKALPLNAPLFLTP